MLTDSCALLLTILKLTLGTKVGLRPLSLMHHGLSGQIFLLWGLILAAFDSEPSLKMRHCGPPIRDLENLDLLNCDENIGWGASYYAFWSRELVIVWFFSGCLHCALVLNPKEIICSVNL